MTGGATPQPAQRADITLAAYGRRALWLVAILAAIAAVAFAIAQVKVVVVSGVVAALIASGLEPVARRLDRRGFRPAVTATLLLVVALGVMASLGSWVISQAWAAGRAAAPTITQSVSRVVDWLQNGPLGLSLADLGSIANRLGLGSSTGGQTLLTGIVGGAATVVDMAEGAVLTVVFSTYFLTRRLAYADWLIQPLPESTRSRSHVATSAAFEGLGGYARAITVSGAINALVVTIVLAVLGIPDAVPLGALAFVLGFFPVIGTLSAGAVATIVAISTKGLVAAVVMVVATAVLHHLEVYVVAPLVVGKVIRFHPAALVAALAIGLAVGGIVGLFLAGPILTMTATTVRSLRPPPPSVEVDARDVYEPDRAG